MLFQTISMIGSFQCDQMGEISPFGRYFLALGAFFSEKYRPNDSP
jgi:hypothetical protein